MSDAYNEEALSNHAPAVLSDDDRAYVHSSGCKVVSSIEVNELSYLTSFIYRNISLYEFIKIIA